MEKDRKMEKSKGVKKIKNTMATPFHPQCRLCMYSGFSRICTFFETGKCVYHEALKEM